MVQKLLLSTKFAIIALLALNDYTLSFKIKPRELNELFKAFASYGNIDVKYSEYFSKLIELVDQDRKTINNYFMTNQNRSDKITNAKSLIEHVENVLKGIDYFRNTPSGIYIQN